MRTWRRITLGTAAIEMHCDNCAAGRPNSLPAATALPSMQKLVWSKPMPTFLNTSEKLW